MVRQKPSKKATEQGGIKKSPISGVAPPKNRQFGQPEGNPRHNGSWKKENTPRYKLEKMMTMSAEELRTIVESEDTPLFDKKIAHCIRDGNWKTLEGMINQVYGTPRQTNALDITSQGKEVQFVKIKVQDLSSGAGNRDS